MGHVLNLETIIKVSNDLRKSGKKVIFTHGTFDLFHAGHAFFLEKCKREGDVLIVGVDVEERVKRYKGNSRPVISTQQRTYLLSETVNVDFTFPLEGNYEDDNAYMMQVYAAINPSLITYGENFGGMKDVRFRKKLVEDVLFKEIKKIVKNEPTTTAIIQKITSTHAQN